MSGGPFTRENETTFRAQPYEEGKRALAHFVFQKSLSFQLREIRQFAQNLSDEDFRSYKYEKGRPDDYEPSDAERPQYGLNGNLYIEHRRHLGFISEQGTERYPGPLYLDMHTRTQVSDRGQIWFHEESEYNDRPGVYVSVYLSEQRMLWLWEQMRLRPDAEVHVQIEAMLWQCEVDEALAEPDMRQEYYLEQGKPAEIVGCTLAVRDPKNPPWHDPSNDTIWDEPSEDPPIAASGQGVSANQRDEQAILLKRLVRGVGWLIGLLVVLLIAVLSK